VQDRRGQGIREQQTAEVPIFQGTSHFISFNTVYSTTVYNIKTLKQAVERPQPLPHITAAGTQGKIDSVVTALVGKKIDNNNKINIIPLPTGGRTVGRRNGSALAPFSRLPFLPLPFSRHFFRRIRLR